MRITALFDNVDAADRAADRVAEAMRIEGRRTIFANGAPPWKAEEPRILFSPYSCWITAQGNGVLMTPQQQTCPESMLLGRDDARSCGEEVWLELSVPDGMSDRADRILLNAHARNLRKEPSEEGKRYTIPGNGVY